MIFTYLTRNTFADLVVQFSSKVNELRSRWPEGPDGIQQGLLLFSGDLFSPSVESMLTKGRNMVKVYDYCTRNVLRRLLPQVHLMNELAPDACDPGTSVISAVGLFVNGLVRQP